jgi:hypothetical protein
MTAGSGGLCASKELECDEAVICVRPASWGVVDKLVSDLDVSDAQDNGEAG